MYMIFVKVCCMLHWAPFAAPFIRFIENNDMSCCVTRENVVLIVSILFEITRVQLVQVDVGIDNQMIG